MNQNWRDARKSARQQKFPRGWDAERVERVLAHYESITEEEQVAEDEAAASEPSGETLISVPSDLLPAIRELLAHHDNA